jgi:hypothetical protein
MSSFNTNKPPEEDKNESKLDAKKKPSFVTKRVIHLAKPVSPPGDGNPRPASNFRHKPASPPEGRNQPEVVTAAQPKTNTGNLKQEGFPIHDDQTVPHHSGKNINPGLRLRSLVTAGRNALPLKSQSKFHLFFKGEQTRRAYWDVAAGFSLIINAILVAILLIMVIQINNLKTTVSGLLSGLYGNFVEMDNASITTTISVDSQVPLNFILPIQQNTEVILTSSVAIPNAHVVINSGGFTINAPASITLPAGTNLPIALNIAVPVQFSIPVTLQVPVIIPLAQTDLHQPFTSLQDTVRAYYCTFDKNAQYPQGIYLCKDHDVPTSIPLVP